MRKFNPEKELYKLKYGKRDKIVLGVFLLLVIVSIGSTFALYQVRHSKRIIYTTVDDFSKDIQLAVFVDGVKKEDFPTKNNNIVYTKISCDDSNVTASWNYEKWGLELFSKLPNKCNVYFETRWKDGSGASYPELYQGLIPITIGSNGELKVADLSKEWYNYDEHEWANAVLIDDSKNHNKYYNEDGTYKKDTTIPIDDVLQMYVWIPRYRYKLWNVLNENSDPFAIEIEFESNTKGRSMGTNKGQWYTHPAFLFGDTELNGIWVGKFEPSDAKDEIGRNSDIGEITILPDKTSMVLKSIKNSFDASRAIETSSKYNLNSKEIDTHMMKNMEWGAVAYLTSSKYGRYNNDGSCIDSGCEVWMNNTAQGTANGGTYTGCVADSVSANPKYNSQDDTIAQCDENKKWNTPNGVKASTTGNMSGIYDMSGGVWEHTMGVIKKQNGDIEYGSSGFTKDNMPNQKYYDLYEYSNSGTTHERGYLGDATRETLKQFGNIYGGWNGNGSVFPYDSTNTAFSWFVRGGRYDYNPGSGIFAFLWGPGGAVTGNNFRVVLTAQEGTE